jgi:hypothetical protein
MSIVMNKPCNNLLLVIMLLAGSVISAQSQHVIRLTNNKTGRVLTIEPGQRVQLYKTNGTQLLGRLESVSSDGFYVIDPVSTFVSLSEVRSIGRHRSGAGILVFAMGFMGTGILIDAAQNNDEVTEGKGLAALGTVAGVCILALAINAVIRNSPRDVVRKWKIEIVDGQGNPTSKDTDEPWY